jgi:hypothetical protein
MLVRLLLLSGVLAGCATTGTGTLEQRAAGVGLAAEDNDISVEKLPTEVSLKAAPVKQVVPPPAAAAKQSPAPIQTAVVERPVTEASGPIEDNAAVVWLSQEGYEYNAGGVFCAGVDVAPQSKQKKIDLACSDGEVAKLKFVQTAAAEVNGEIILADNEVREIIVLAR